MPSLCRICFYCNGASKLRTMVPITDYYTIVSYKCVDCQREEEIIIDTKSIGNTEYLCEYIPADMTLH